MSVKIGCIVWGNFHNQSLKKGANVIKHWGTDIVAVGYTKVKV